MIDLTDWDKHEHGITPAVHYVEPVCDFALAQRIRDSLREQKDTRLFAEADKRMQAKQ